MCGISVLYSKSPKDNSDFYLKHRGPDSYSSLEKDEFFMAHYLLHLTGDVTNQPVNDEDIEEPVIWFTPILSLTSTEPVNC